MTRKTTQKTTKHTTKRTGARQTQPLDPGHREPLRGSDLGLPRDLLNRRTFRRDAIRHPFSRERYGNPANAPAHPHPAVRREASSPQHDVESKAVIIGAAQPSSFALRVRFKSSCEITVCYESSGHESDAGDVDRCDGGFGGLLPILCEPAASVEPGEYALDHPPPGARPRSLLRSQGV